MDKDYRKYPHNLLRQIFIGEQYENLADDSGAALEYVMQVNLDYARFCEGWEDIKGIVE